LEKKIVKLLPFCFGHEQFLYFVRDLNVIEALNCRIFLYYMTKNQYIIQLKGKKKYFIYIFV